MSVAVVVPAYRAAASIGDVVTRTRRCMPDARVLVVDDGSDDDTAARALAAGATVASHEQNQGKGRALATGLAAAVALDDVRFVVTIDADGQHPPEEIPRLLQPLEAGNADLVIGSRRRDPLSMPRRRRLSNWLSSKLITRATGQHVPDSQSGFRAMTRAVASDVRPQGSRYEYETEFLLVAARQGRRIAAVEVPTIYANETSHFRSVSDTVRVARVLMRNWRTVLS